MSIDTNNSFYACKQHTVITAKIDINTVMTDDINQHLARGQNTVLNLGMSRCDMDMSIFNSHCPNVELTLVTYC